MEADNFISPFCICCLKADEGLLRRYKIQSKPLRNLIQDEVILCYICLKIAQYTDLFVNNVQQNQTNLQDLSNTHPIIKLSLAKLEPLEFTGSDNIEDSEFTIVRSEGVKIKTEMTIDEEMKSEDSFSDNNYEGQIKQEDDDDLPLLSLKEENIPSNIVESVNMQYKKVKKKKQKNNISTKMKNNHLKRDINNEDALYNKIRFTNSDLLKERKEKLAEASYQKSQFKCSNCVLGFIYKMTYEKHMKLHDKSTGEYACKICKQYLKTRTSLANHMKNHYIRYQCKICGLQRNVSRTITNHYLSKHCEMRKLNCPKIGCSKSFTLQIKLRKHIYRVHNDKARTVCKYCNNTYTNIYSHMANKHQNEISLMKKDYNHACQHCELAFASLSRLKLHMVKHSDIREHYCVECDKKFKSEFSLKAHLQTSIHLSSKDLPFACTHCDKRFIRKCLLERHMKRVMNIRQYQCDQCDKSYICPGEMRRHKKLTHEGYELPRKYKCEYCDKAFKAGNTLKHHILTHTGERPYQCKQCSAAFNQSSILRTHTRLVHLRVGGRKRKCNISDEDTISS